jgi:dephospho-CoA kinase
MSLIYITGPTAAGKTTLGEALRAKGFEVHDTDDEGMRHWCDKFTKEPVDPPIKNALEDPHWHEDHIFTLSEEPVLKLYEKAKNKTIFLCGITQTDLDYKHLFSKIILLKIDEETQKHRIINRTNHNYGKPPHQFAAALKWRKPQIEKYQAAGAHEIDATKPLDQIVDEVLSFAMISI